jgi:hypothetical protein
VLPDYTVRPDIRQPTLPNPHGPRWEPNRSAQLARLILTNGLTSTFQPPSWAWTRRPSVDLPDLFGPEARERFNRFAFVFGQQPQPQDSVQAGFPQRVNVTLPWSQPPQPPRQGPNFIDQTTTDLLGEGSMLGAAMGAVPGQQAGGTVDAFGVPIATTPMTLSNFSAWGREGVLAFLDSVFTGGNYITEQGETMFDENGRLVDPNAEPTGQRTYIDDMIAGIKQPFDLINGAFEGVIEWWRTSNAENRALSVQSLARTGRVTPFLIDGITSFVTGGSAKFSQESIAAIAQQRGMAYDEMVAEYYDLDPGIVRQIFANPEMSNAQITELVRNAPLSRNPAVNMALEFGLQGATLLVPYAGLTRAAGLAGRLGGSAPGFARGLSTGQRVAQGATATQRASPAGAPVGRCRSTRSTRRRAGRSAASSGASSRSRRWPATTSSWPRWTG